MKIVRMINGVKYNIELLPEELENAFYEQQHKFDIEDIISYGEMMSKEELEQSFNCSYCEFLSMKEDMATEMRRNMNKYGMDFAYAREEAIQTVIQQNRVVC